VEVALKLAFQYWRQCPEPRPEKTCYVALGDAYHGDTLGSVSVGGVARFHDLFRPLLFEVLRLPTPRLYRLPPGVPREQACAHYLAQAERLLAEHHRRVAALVIEPMMQAAAGMIVHPPGYLRGIRELTRRYGVLLVADEVAVGFGRTGRMFACEHEQVSPDLLCQAKGLTGGYMPMAATLACSEIWNAFLGTGPEMKQFFHGHTYGGNPLAAAVALASLDVFEQEQVLAKLPAKIARLSQHLGRIAKKRHVGDVRQLGLLAGIELVRNRETQEAYGANEPMGGRVCQQARREGILLRPLGNVIVIVPPLAISHADLDRLMLVVERAISKVTEETAC
jgi:adenosylmethionine-8-amino-7-oxononanoate aminotransferase